MAPACTLETVRRCDGASSSPAPLPSGCKPCPRSAFISQCLLYLPSTLRSHKQMVRSSEAVTMSSPSSPNDVMHVTLCRCAATGTSFSGRCVSSRLRDTLPPMLAVDPEL
jgi:hypothetical protein